MCKQMIFRPPTILLTVAASATMLLGCFKEPTGPEAVESLAPPGRLVVSSSADTLNAIGHELQLYVLRQDLDGNSLPGTAVTWRSANPEVATVDENGRVVSRGIGAALVVVACTACNDIPDTASVWVRQVVAHTSLKPEAATLARGFAGRLRAVAADSNNVKIKGASYTWSSSEPGVASVTDGTVDALSVGTTMIDVSVGEEQATAWITVVATSPTVASVDVTPADTTLYTGETAQLIATAEDASGVAILGLSFAWASSDSSVVQVSQGVIEAVSTGQAEITATGGGLTASAVVTVIPPPPPPDFVLPAFPGAEGYGAGALNDCDRGSPHVFAVTNLADAGPGSFRQAMANAEVAPNGELKVIVFRVAGYIDSSSAVQFAGNCLYIAGQTAPGDGVTLRRRGLEFHRNPRDIVIRYLRIRLGTTGGQFNGILVRQGTNYILDHLSLSWSPETHLRFSRTPISRSGPIHYVTIQRSLLGESLSAHPTAIQIGGEPDTDDGGAVAGWRENTHYSVHHNALVSNSHRNPNARGLYVNVINNVVHNWNLDAGQTGRGAVVDFINNFTQKGPMSSGDKAPFGVATGHVLDAPFYKPSIYAVGNLSLGGGVHSDQNTNPNADNWEGSTGIVDWYQNDSVQESVTQFRRDFRLDFMVPPPEIPVTIQNPYDALDSVLDDVGANVGLNCSGGWIPRDDGVDGRLLQEIRDGGGWADRPGPDHENAVGGFPTLTPGTPCTDSDGDGMPDEWETANGLDPNNSGDAGRIGRDGYSYLEHFLNGTNP